MKKTIILSIIILSSMLLLSGCEREGVVNTDDCRETIYLKDGDVQTYYKTFTCLYSKTNSGDLISGSCTNISTGWFNSKCKTAYVYEKEPFKKCPSGQYLANSGECDCVTGVKRNNRCISKNENCKLSFGKNAEASLDVWGDNEESCKCLNEFKWNDKKTNCIPIWVSDNYDSKCKLTFGSNAQGVIHDDTRSISCECADKYKWSEDGTICVPN